MGRQEMENQMEIQIDTSGIGKLRVDSSNEIFANIYNTLHYTLHNDVAQCDLENIIVNEVEAIIPIWDYDAVTLWIAWGRPNPSDFERKDWGTIDTQIREALFLCLNEFVKEVVTTDSAEGALEQLHDELAERKALGLIDG